MQADDNSIIQTFIFGGQLLATTCTFIYLYKSLKAQRKANSLTNKKFIYDIKPIFKREVKQIDQGFVPSIPFTNFTILLTNNAAYTISIIKEEFQTETGFIERSEIPILAVSEEIPIIGGVFTPNQLKQEVIIKIRFDDEVGTTYEQKIHGVLADLHLTPPYKIKTSE